MRTDGLLSCFKKGIYVKDLQSLPADLDFHWMSIALSEADVSRRSGDFPVGAVLCVEGEFWGSARNRLFSQERTTAHAEHTLISELSGRLRTYASGREETNITLYSTLEPCLMCLGVAVLHRVSRIVFACPDPNGGVSTLDAAQLPPLYQRGWPTFAAGPLQKESRALVMEFLREGKFSSSKRMLEDFQRIE